MKTNKSDRNPLYLMVYGAAIAAIYIILFMLFEPIGSGVIQFRISELLCVMPYFTPAAIPGLFIGGGVPMDIIGGSLATLIGAVGSYLLRKNRYLVSVPPIVSNMLIIPWVLKYGYGSDAMIWFSTITIGIGEFLAIGVLGQILLGVLEKYKGVLFDSRVLAR